MRKRCLIIFTGALISVTLIPTSYPIAAAEEPPISVIDAARGSERDRIAASDGEAERHGKDLMIWLANNGPNEKGVVFRNWSVPGNSQTDPNGDSFVYYGKIGKSHLVQENLTHDAPLLYLIEDNGVERRYRLGDETPYATGSGQRVVSLRQSSIGGAPLISVVGLHDTGEPMDDEYQPEFRCDANDSNGTPNEEAFSARVISISDDDIAVEVKGDRWPTPNKEETRTLGVLRIHRDGYWTVQEPKVLWEQVTCR